MSILGALAEVVSVTAFLVIVRRPTESPTELYLRRQRESANAWQEVDR
jgi:hypothetical protein